MTLYTILPFSATAITVGLTKVNIPFSVMIVTFKNSCFSLFWAFIKHLLHKAGGVLL